MTSTTGNRYGRVLGIAAMLLFALGASGASAQEDGRWLPWLGCWEPSGAAQDFVAEDTRPYVVCVTAAEGGARFATIADGEVVAERTIIADGQRRDVEQSGCAGWESATWSGDDQRVYLRSELACEGGVDRVTSGVLTVATPTAWLDIQGVAVAGNEAMRVRRYRTASEARLQAAGARPETQQERALALATARTGAAAPLSVDDVQEASRVLSADVVGALLIERESDIRVDADALRSLAEADVPVQVIDLMVALANPDKFTVDRGDRQAVERPDEPRERGDRSYSPRYYGIYDYDPFWYGSRYYGYGSLYYGGFGRYGYGWGDRYGYWYGTPRIIVVQPSDDDPAPNGRYVKGRGYVPRNSGSSGGDDVRGSRSGSSGSSGSKASGSGTRGSNPPSSSGTSTGRTTKKRGGGGK